jgi:hypothetical protein
LAILVLVVLLFSNVALLPSPVLAEDGEGPWEGDDRVDSGQMKDREFSSIRLITAPGDKLVAGWYEDRDGEGDECYVAVSEDGGHTWSPNEEPVEDHQNQFPWPTTCDVEADADGHVFAAFTQRTLYGWRVRFSRSDDGGLSFRNPVDVYPAGDDTEEQKYPALATSRTGTLYILYHHRTPESKKLFVATSDDGLTVQNPRGIEPGATTDIEHVQGDIAVGPDGTVYVAYGYRSAQLHGIRLAQKPAAAGTFSVSEVYNVSADTGTLFRPRIAVSEDGIIEVAFLTGGEQEVLYHMRSEDGGGSFKSPVSVFSNVSTGDEQTDPDITFDVMGRLHVLWTQGGMSKHQVLHSLSSDGVVFTSPFEVGEGWDEQEMGPRGFEGPGAVTILSNGTINAAFLAIRNGTLGVWSSRWVNQPPEVQIDFPRQGAMVKGSMVVQGKASDSGGATNVAWVFMEVEGMVPVRLPGATSWENEVDTLAVPDGETNISAWASDGFLVGPRKSIIVIVDNNNPPTMELTSPPNSWSGKGKVPVTGTAYDPEGFKPNWIVQWKFPDTNWTDLGKGTLLDDHNATFDFILDLSTVISGPYFFTIRVMDGAKGSEPFTVTINLNNRPDLYVNVSMITWDPVEPKPGDIVTFTAHVENIGATTADGYQATFRIGPLKIGTSSPSNLQPGEEEAHVFSWEARAGNFTFHMKADDDSLIEEADEQNNEGIVNLGIAKPEDEDDGFPIWIPIVVVIVIVAAAGAAVLLMRKPKMGVEPTVPYEESASGGGYVQSGGGVHVEPGSEATPAPTPEPEYAQPYQEGEAPEISMQSEPTGPPDSQGLSGDGSTGDPLGRTESMDGKGNEPIPEEDVEELTKPVEGFDEA